MRRGIVSIVVLLAFTAMASADSWKMVTFDSILGGAVSYDASGDNVVVSGTAFHTALTAGGFLGTQVVGGDGINVSVAGNFGVYGVFHYVDNDNVLGWAQANANTPLDIEVRAMNVQFDIDGDGSSDFEDFYKLAAVDMPGVDYLDATFSELATWGYTELAPGVWMDIALSNDYPGLVAMSIVIDGFSLHGSDQDLHATILSGSLGGPVAGQYVGSGIRVAAVPVPGAVLLGVLGLSAACPFCRRKKS